MRSWLLIDAEGDKLSERRSVHVIEFTSGDGDEPMEGDLIEALSKMLGEHAPRPGVARDYALVLVPLDDARTVNARPKFTAEVVSWGGLA